MRTFLARFEGTTGWLVGEEFHHAIRVDRFREGDEIRVLDGEGGVFRARIVSVDRKKRVARLEILEALSSLDPPREVFLAVSVLRPERMRFLVEKATEVGVSRIRFLHFARSLERSVPAERLRRVAWEAVKQCGRSLPPELEGPQPLKTFIESVQEGLVVLDRDGAPPSAFRPPRDPVWVVVGPEGGFTPGERQMLEARGAVVLSLGNTVLRAETAALIGVWRMLYGFVFFSALDRGM